MFVAVVCLRSNLGVGVTHAHTFTGNDKEFLIRKALKVREDWKTKQGLGADRYGVFIGEMTHEVHTPIAYRLEPITQEL